MKTISLWQPHATWIAMKWKTIETRTHARFAGLVGQRVAIHAAKKYDADWGLFPSIAIARSAADIVNILHWMRMCMGKIVCTTVISELIRPGYPQGLGSPLEWERRACAEVEGKHLYFLEDIEPLAHPVPFKGGRGIFNVPDELIPIGGNG